MESVDHKRRKKNWKFQLPGFKRLQDFTDTFRDDFNSLQTPKSRQAITINFGSPNQGSSSVYELTESINVESSPTTNTNISNPVAIDSSQPSIVHAKESPASGAVTSASSSPSTSPAIFVSSDDAVDSGKAATVEGVTLAVPYPSLRETGDGGQEASETEEDGKRKEKVEPEDIAAHQKHTDL